jgi:hypothetical protein
MGQWTGYHHLRRFEPVGSSHQALLPPRVRPLAVHDRFVLYGPSRIDRQWQCIVRPTNMQSSRHVVFVPRALLARGRVHAALWEGGENGRVFCVTILWTR